MSQHILGSSSPAALATPDRYTTARNANGSALRASPNATELPAFRAVAYPQITLLDYVHPPNESPKTYPVPGAATV